MAGNRSVGRPSNDAARMEPRAVSVAHDRPRINDNRKVRPHSAGDPAMGIRPSGGAQREPKKPRLNTDFMQLRDVPMDTITEAELLELGWPFRRRNPSFQSPYKDAIAWHNGAQGITIFRLVDGNIVDSFQIPNYQTLTDRMKKAKQAYADAATSRQDVRLNWRRTARDAAIDYVRNNRLNPEKMGELGREIPFNPPSNGGEQNPSNAGADPGGANPAGTDPGGANPAPPSSSIRQPFLDMPDRPTKPSPGQSSIRQPFLNMPGGPTRPPAAQRNATPSPAPPSPRPDALEPEWESPPARQPEAIQPEEASAGGVTPEMRASLQRAGYNDAQIQNMPPEEARLIAASADMSLEQKFNLLRRFNPKKYDNSVAARNMSGSEHQIRGPFERAIRTPRGAELLKLFMSESNQMNEAWRMHSHREQSPMTIRAALHAIKEIGMVGKWNREYQEFMVNFPNGSERTAHYTEDANDAVGTARVMHDEMARQGNMHEAYPDTSFERNEPAHESRIGDLGRHGHQQDPGTPACNQDFMQARELHIERIHEVADREIADMIENTLFDIGLGDLIGEGNWDTYSMQPDSAPRRQFDRSDQFESELPRIRHRWIGENIWNKRGHLPKPSRPLPRNIAGSGKDFRVKPGHNKSKKQPGNLIGSNHVNKVKPGFIG